MKIILYLYENDVIDERTPSHVIIGENLKVNINRSELYMKQKDCTQRTLI